MDDKKMMFFLNLDAEYRLVKIIQETCFHLSILIHIVRNILRKIINRSKFNCCFLRNINLSKN